MDYLADTVALVRHLRGGQRFGRRAKGILEEADQGRHIIAISGVTLMEVLYLSERRRISVDLEALGDLLARSRNYTVVPVGLEVVRAAAMSPSCTTG
jgi:predicted nucleic acid-binding protein